MLDPKVERFEFAIEATPKAWLDFLGRYSNDGYRRLGVNIIQLSETQPVASPSVLIEMFPVPGHFSIPLVTEDAMAEFIGETKEFDAAAKAEANVLFNTLSSHFENKHQKENLCHCGITVVRGYEVPDRVRGMYAGFVPQTFMEATNRSQEEILRLFYGGKHNIGKKRAGMLLRMGKRLNEDIYGKAGK